MNRLKTKQLGVNNSVTYAYTANGLMSSTVDARGTTSYNYDARDQLIEQTETDGQTLQYTYDKASNRTSITTQAGTTTYGYDRYNELTTVTDKNGGVTTYTYDKAGNRTKIQMAEGTVETRNYDLLNHLVKQETSNATGVIAGYTYTLDAGGKQVELLEHNGRKVDYSYDKIDRLLMEQITDSTNGNRTTGYVYDPIGNRVSKTDSVAGVTTYVYDNNDRLLTETNGTKITTSTYDRNGNNLTRGDGTSLTTNTWDIENRLIRSVTDASTTIYQYDPNGVRVSSQTNGVETRYLVDRNRPHASVMLEYDVNGNSLVDYTYGIGLISQQRNNVTSLYHADGLGSTRFLTDSSGSVTDTYVYDAYGNTLSSSGATVNNYLYTGEQFDKNLGEYYLRARYYNPSAGRFTGRDPFDGMLDQPLSLNKYGYVHGNPINNTDPSGMLLWGLLGDEVAETALATQEAAYNSSILSLVGRVLISSFGRSAGIAFGTTFSISVAQWARLILAESDLKACNIDENQECEARGLPILFSGDTFRGESLRQTTLHTYDAITKENKHSLLSAWDSQPSSHTENGNGIRQWYKFKPECDKSGMSTGQKKSLGCDEYPFFSTNEGGYSNYSANRVSLRLVPTSEKGQGLLVGAAASAGVVKGDVFKEWYGVVAIPGFPSFWFDRQRKRIT
jgi:RHS repeat-associated protein